MKEQKLNPKLTESLINHKKIDFGSETYHEIRRFIDARIGVLRRINDNDADSDKTAKIRGSISEMKNLLSKLEPKKMLTK